MRLLAFGDLHLGAGTDRLDDQAAVLDRIVDLAVDRRVDAVCFGGDATHHRSAIQEIAIFQRGVESLRRLGIPFYAIAGNHDVTTADAASTVEVAAGSAAVTVARVPGVMGREHGVTICALPWTPTASIAALDPTGQVDDVARTASEILMDIARGLRAQVQGPAVLVLHWSMSGAVTPTGALVDEFRECVLPSRELAEIGFDVVIGSHIHTAGMLVEDPHPVLYTGSAATVDFGEENTEHGAWLIDFDGGALSKIEFLPIEDRPFVTLGYEHGAISCAEALTPTIVGLEGAIVRVRYDATPEQERNVDHELIRAILRDVGVARVHAIEANIARSDSARTAVSDDLGVDEAFALWLNTQELTPEERASALAVHYEIGEVVA